MRAHFDVPARHVYFCNEAITAFANTLAFTVSTLYLLKIVHLDPLQLVTIGTVIEGTVLVFQIPTGVVADTLSRRGSVILGNAIMGLALIGFAHWPSYVGVLIAQAGWAFGYTFTSGSTTAWIAGELGDVGLRDLFIRVSQLRRFVAMLAIGAATMLGIVSLRLPIFAGGGIFVALSIAQALTMSEHNFTRTPPSERETWTQFREMIRAGAHSIRQDATLVALLFVTIVAGAASEAFDRLWQPQLLTATHVPNWFGTSPIVFLGVLDATALFLSILCARPLRRKLRHSSDRPMATAVFVLMSLQTVALVAFGAASVLWLAVGAWIVHDIAKGLQGPVYSAWIVPLIPQRVRATVLSTLGQGDALGQVAGGPALGGLARRVSIRAAMFASAGLMTPALVVIANIRTRLTKIETSATTA